MSLPNAELLGHSIGGILCKPSFSDMELLNNAENTRLVLCKLILILQKPLFHAVNTGVFLGFCVKMLVPFDGSLYPHRNESSAFS